MADFTKIPLEDKPQQKKKTKQMCSVDFSFMENLSESAKKFLSDFLNCPQLREEDIPLPIKEAINSCTETIDAETMHVLIQSINYRSPRSISIRNVELLSEIAKTQGFLIQDGLPLQLKEFLTHFPVMKDGLEVLKTVKIYKDMVAYNKNVPTFDQHKHFLTKTKQVIESTEEIWKSIGGNSRAPEKFKQFVSRRGIAEEMASHPYHITPGNFQTFATGNFTTLANWIKRKNHLSVMVDLDPIKFENQQQYFKVSGSKVTYNLKKWVVDLVNGSKKKEVIIKRLVDGTLVEKPGFSKTGKDDSSRKGVRKNLAQRIPNATEGKSESKNLIESLPETQALPATVKSSFIPAEEWAKLSIEQRQSIRDSRPKRVQNGFKPEVWKTMSPQQKASFLAEKNSRIQQPKVENVPQWGPQSNSQVQPAAPTSAASKDAKLETLFKMFLLMVNNQ
jgi:hypothetical protein